MSCAPGPLTRVALLALTLAAGAASVHAQGLEAGVRVGPLYSTVSADADGSAPAFDWRLGYSAGGFAKWPLGAVRLGVEALYVQKGAAVDEGGIEAQLILDYVEVPVLVSASRASLGGRVYLAGGAAPAFRIRARSRADFGGAVEEIDATDEIEPLDLALVAAAGLERGRVVFDARYAHGIRNIDAADSRDVRIFTRAVSVTVGIRFR